MFFGNGEIWRKGRAAFWGFSLHSNCKAPAPILDNSEAAPDHRRLLSKIKPWFHWLWGNLKALCAAVILALGMLPLLLSVTSSLGKYHLELLQSSELQVLHSRVPGITSPKEVDEKG